MKKHLVTILTAAAGGALLAGASPAAAAPPQAAAERPSTTTPDGKTLHLSEFVGLYYSLLQPASAGDSVWTEVRGSTTQIGKQTATADAASLTSTPKGPFWTSYRACASTVRGVTCTAYNPL